MNAAETECLNQDDIRLFHKGACHIFASALKQAFPCESYSLKRVVLLREFDSKEAYHVLAERDDFVVDASGIKRTSDYVAWLKAWHVEKSFGSTIPPEVKLHETSEVDLFTHYHDDPHLGSVNQWGLFSDGAFVTAARVRAQTLIKHWPEKYQVSILQGGLLFQRNDG
ncbi:MAG TPA: hypothetical protein VMA13_08410 [Candidatus Saccharimonadales bacterium]|nr:hypothetical protein [Candidatus Saccharimonadales bacterium]